MINCFILGLLDESMQFLFEISVFRYVGLMYVLTTDVEKISRPLRRVVSIDSFAASSCYIYFKFRKNDLRTLLELLRFPEDCKLYNNGTMKG